MRPKARALTRHRTVSPDPKALFAALDGAVLFETGDATRSGPRRSILVTHVAVRLEIRGATATLVAVSHQGKTVLDAVAERLRGNVVSRKPSRLELVFPRVPAAALDDDADAVLHASTPLDALRALLHVEVVGDPGPFAVFAAVLCAYDLVDVFEVLPPPAVDRHGLPDLVALLAEGAVLVDSAAWTTHVFSTAFSDDEAAVNDAAQRLVRIEAALDEMGDAVATRRPRRKPSRRWRPPHLWISTMPPSRRSSPS